MPEFWLASDGSLNSKTAGELSMRDGCVYVYTENLAELEYHDPAGGAAPGYFDPPQKRGHSAQPLRVLVLRNQIKR